MTHRMCVYIISSEVYTAMTSMCVLLVDRNFMSCSVVLLTKILMN